jgi:hypothetical protein
VLESRKDSKGTIMPDNELADFHAFVGSQLQAGDCDLSPEEVLDIWRDTHPCSEDDATEAIREALADMAGGDHGISIEEFEREFRKQFPKP